MHRTLILACSLVIVACQPAARPPSHMAQARAAMRSERWSEASRAFEAATRMQPQLIGAWLGLSRARLRMRRWDAARQAAERAVVLEGRSADAHQALARAHLGRQDWPGARSELARTLELDPARAALHFELARALERLDRPDDAAQAYRRALAADVEPIATRLALARLSIDAGDLTQAERHLAEAREHGADAIAVAALERRIGNAYLKRLRSTVAEQIRLSFARTSGGFGRLGMVDEDRAGEARRVDVSDGWGGLGVPPWHDRVPVPESEYGVVGHGAGATSP